MAKRYTWSELLDDLYKMKIESDKDSIEKPLLSPFIEKICEQQFSLFSENPRPGNLEVLFGYCVASVTITRQAQLKHEKEGNVEKADLLNQCLANAMNMIFDTLEVLARKEIAEK